MHHPVIGRFPEKSFTVSYRDTPVLFNRGVYESALATSWNQGRCVTGCYALSGHENGAIQSDGSAVKDLLFSFTGRLSHPVRRQLMATTFHRRDILLEDTSTFNYWDYTPALRAERERHFAAVLSSSRSALCPRGVGAGSIRLFEAMRAGVAPIILADDWMSRPVFPGTSSPFNCQSRNCTGLSRWLPRESTSLLPWAPSPAAIGSSASRIQPTSTTSSTAASSYVTSRSCPRHSTGPCGTRTSFANASPPRLAPW